MGKAGSRPLKWSALRIYPVRNIPVRNNPESRKIQNINRNPAIPPKLGEGEVLASYPDLT